eukprot:527777_1
MANKLIAKVIQTSCWENTVNEALQFINNNIENKGQLVNIVTTNAGKQINQTRCECIIYYYKNKNEPSKAISNQVALKCNSLRQNNKTHLQSANAILPSINNLEPKGLLFGTTHAIQDVKHGGNGYPITFVWCWNITPIYQTIAKDEDETKESNQSIENEKKASKEWTVSEVGVWLTQLGASYAKYVEKFKNDGIDGELMGELDSNDLSYIVSNTIHRKKILLSWKKALNK